MKCYCKNCIFFKYEDSEGYGYCDQWEEADVQAEDEACVEYQEEPSDEF